MKKGGGGGGVGRGMHQDKQGSGGVGGGGRRGRGMHQDKQGSGLQRLILSLI